MATVTKSLVFQAPAAWDVLKEHGYDLTFAAQRDTHAAALESWGGVREVALQRQAVWRNAAVVRQVHGLLREDWDLVQLQSPVAAAIARSVAPRRDPRHPTLYVAHGLHVTQDFPVAKNVAFGAVEQALAGRTSAIAVVSGEDFALAQRLGWHRRALVWQLPGAGVDVAAFEAATAEVDRGVMPRTALFCGEMNANKDIEFALEVARGLRARGDLDRLVLVGDGPQRNLAVEASREPWIEYLPFSREIPKLMASAHLLIHTSHREGLPRVIIEAMGSGLPVLARSNRGSRELVVSEVGYTLPKESDTLDDWLREGSRLLREGIDPMASRSRAARYSVARFRQSYS